MRYAVFDIGSNSVKFLVVEKKDSSFRVLEEQSHATRLAEDLIFSGQLKPEAMERTLKVLGQLKAEADKLGATRFAAAATSAVRDSKNRKAFLKEAKSILGFPVMLLSGTEEAESIFAGVAADHHWKKSDLFVIDVGGGSAEWIEGKSTQIVRRTSLPLGCVRLRERFIHQHPVGAAGVDRLLAALHDQLQPALAHYHMGKRLLVGTGGTMTCLAGMELKLKEFDPHRINHFCLTRTQAHQRLRKLQKLSLAQLKKVPGLPAKRVDLIIPGAAVVYASMEILGAHEVHISIRGLRYGLLHRLMHHNL